MQHFQCFFFLQLITLFLIIIERSHLIFVKEYLRFHLERLWVFYYLLLHPQLFFTAFPISYLLLHIRFLLLPVISIVYCLEQDVITQSLWSFRRLINVDYTRGISSILMKNCWATFIEKFHYCIIISTPCLFWFLLWRRNLLFVNNQC